MKSHINIKKELIKQIFKNTMIYFFLIILIEGIIIFILSNFMIHIKLIVDALTIDNKTLVYSYLKYIAKSVGIATFLRYFIQYPLLNRLYSKINTNGKNIAYDFFSKIPIDKIKDETHLKINSITENINNMIFNVHVILKDKISSFGIIIVTLYKFMPKIALCLLLYMVILMIYAIPFTNKLHKSGEQLNEARLNSREFINDISKNFFIQKLYNLNLLNKNYFNKYIEEENQAVKKNVNNIQMFLLFINTVNIIVVILTIIMIIKSDITGEAKGKVGFLLISGLFANGVSGFVMHMPLFITIWSEITNSLNLFNYPLENNKEILNINDINNIKMHNITYTYEDINSNKKIFNNFSYELKKGINILDAPSGSGKSTLIKLMIGLYELQSGDVIINDQYSIKDYNILNNITYITQSDMIYNRTIEENLLLNSTPNNIYNDYINNTKLKNILHKKTGVNGHFISGGECKRIIIGRSLIKYKEGNVLIFDEPFIGLDYALIEEIIKIIISYKNNIIIIIDHTQLLKKFLIEHETFFNIINFK